MDIEWLASIAKIRLSGAEKEEIHRELAPLLELAESLSKAKTGGAPLSQKREVMPISALREDVPAPRTAAKDAYIARSPSEGDDGFTIPRLLE